MDKVHYSSGNEEWETPEYLFSQLNEEFHFTLDACATLENTKCKKFYTKEENGLAQDWSGETVFCNPPYTKKDIRLGILGQEAWIKKCFYEGQKTTVVMLIPARTDTKAFHEFIYGKAEIRFIRGRIRFIGGVYNAPFPSMIVIFKPK
jgi:phage N-6-adenine-methyltransferase